MSKNRFYFYILSLLINGYLVKISYIHFILQEELPKYDLTLFSAIILIDFFMVMITLLLMNENKTYG